MCCGRLRRVLSGRCCCFRGVRIRLCCCVWRRRRFVRRGFRLRCCMWIRARIFRRRSSFVIVVCLSLVSDWLSRWCRTRSTRAVSLRSRDRARLAIVCKPQRCWTRSPASGLIARSVAQDGMRSARARKSASSRYAMTSERGTQRTSVPNYGTSTTRGSARVSTPACSRCRTGLSLTCGNTFKASSWRSRRSTSRTAAKSSTVTACSTRTAPANTCSTVSTSTRKPFATAPSAT